MLQIRSVLLADNIDVNCPRILNENGINTLDFPKELKKRGISGKNEVLQELLNELKNHDGIIVRSGTTVTKEVLASAPNLKLIGRAGTGVDNIDMAEATKQGVVVMNTPAGNSRSAAELTCTMIMNLARHVPQAHRKMNEGVWARKDYMGTEIYGKTLAIIGLGRIGKEVSQRMQAFGMKTIGYDPLVTAEQASEFGVELLSLEQIWPRADYITVHVPLIPQTKNLIGSETLPKCKKGVKVINVARGGVVHESEVLKSIEAGHCAGAAFDVFQDEPPFADPISKNLIANDKVITTPHLGASTVEAQYRVAVEIADQIVAFHSGKEILGALNARPLIALLDPTNMSSIKAVEQLASTLAALIKGSSSKGTQVVVECDKDAVKLSDALKASTLVGFLKTATSNGLNLINAAGYAEAAGITVSNSVIPSLGSKTFKISAIGSGGSVAGYVIGCASPIGTVLMSVNGNVFDTGVVIKENVVISSENQLDLITKFESLHLVSAKSSNRKCFVDVFKGLSQDTKNQLESTNSTVIDIES